MELERKKATAGRTRALKNAKLLCFIIVSYKYCMSCMDNRQGEIEKSEDDLTFFSLVFSTSAVQLFFKLCLDPQSGRRVQFETA